MGYAEEVFVDFERISQKLKCPVCLSVMQDAVFHLNCQNGFCKGCIDRVSSCPCCRGPVQHGKGIVADITRRELIWELPSRCALGCGWTGPLERLEQHTRECKASGAREREERVTCRVCGDKMPLRELPEHQAACKVRCPFFPRCTDAVPLKDLAQHTATCPMQPLPCPNYLYGCKYQGLRREMKRHRLQCSYSAHNPLFQRCRALEGTVLELRGRLLQSSTNLTGLGEAEGTPDDDETSSEEQDLLPLSPLRAPSPPSLTGNAGRFVWRIAGFANRCERYIESRAFTDTGGEVWTFRIYPLGDGNTHGFITFGAYKTTDSFSKYSVEIPNANPALSLSRSIAPTHSRWATAGWGWRRLVRRDRLVKQGYVDLRGALTIIITVRSDMQLSSPAAPSSLPRTPARLETAFQRFAPAATSPALHFRGI